MASLEFVRMLVSAGADVNLRLERKRTSGAKLNLKGATPFLMAADTADLGYMQLLFELGADPTIPNVDGATALMAAAGLGTHAPGEEAGNEAESLAAVEWLLSIGMDINAVSDTGETVMHGATYASFPEMVRYLSDRGASVAVWNQKNKRGWTPHLIAEGHRPGNFKPAAETLKAIQDVMRAQRATIPQLTPRRIPRRQGYDSNDAQQN